MHITLNRMKQIFPKLNLISYTFADVERIAKRERINITICRYNPDILGYYCTRRTKRGIKRFIVINSILDETARTFVALHEIAHHFLHEPVSSRQWYYCRRNAERTNSKHDCEADSFALIAMIPASLLLELETMDASEIHPALAELCLKRKELRILKGI
jgi:Zn-dependent peptidase ImmA (M78 family)